MKKLIWGIRLFLFYAGIIPATIIIATFGWLCAPLPDLWCYRIITSWSHFFIWWVKVTCGLRYKVIGKKNLPQAPFVVLCNHQSMWETIFMQVLLPPQSWVLKRELLWIPFFGWGLALIKPIAVYRDRLADVKFILQQGKKRINAGRCVVFYPEGTRIQPGKTKRYSRTGAALAIDANIPVVPIAHNAGNFWPRGPWIKRPGIITIKIGEPIMPKGHDASSLTKSVEAWNNQQKGEMTPVG
jgi:1-acyl-sn-glycerol-3-phosphate acyltransferase